MERRSFIKTVGGIGTTATIGGAGLLAMSGSAAAAGYVFRAHDAGIDIDDGDVSRVHVDIDGDLTWKNFDEEITQLNIVIESRVLTEEGGDVIDGWKIVRGNEHKEGQNPVSMPDDKHGKSGSYSGDVGSDTLTLYSGPETEPFDVDADGETNDVVVELRLTIDLLNSDGEMADPQDEARVRETASFTAETQNLPASTSGSSTANTTME